MLAKFPTVPVGHQVWSTVLSPLKKAPMEGITIAGVCIVLEMATFPGRGYEGVFGGRTPGGSGLESELGGSAYVVQPVFAL
jgi:hypothetical protein